MTNVSQSVDIEFLQESVAALEAELVLLSDDAGWIRMLGAAGDEFSKAGIDKISALSRLMYLKNPLINRGIEVKKDYVLSQGLTISARQAEINAVVQRFMDDMRNRAELTSHQALQQKEVERQTDGNIFLLLFTNQHTGRVRVRSVRLPEIQDIICNPEDSKEPWYYCRSWQQRSLNGTLETQQAYYPDWRYRPASRPAAVNGIAVKWDAPCYHIRSGGFSDWRWGISDVYSALDWAKAYKSFLEDWATITRALARFAFKVKTAGGMRGVAATKSRLNTTLGTGSGQGERNPPPAAGSTWIENDSVDMQPIKTAGATTSMEDGRRILLMVAAAVGLPETFFGDSSAGSLATARSLDRPTELMMLSIQKSWIAVLTDLLSYVLYWSVKAPRGPLAGFADIDLDDEDEEVLTWRDDPETGEPYNPTVNIDFPPVVEIDPLANVQAIATSAPFVPDERLVARLILNALSVPNADEVLDAMFDAQAQLDGEVAESAATLRDGLAQLVEVLRDRSR